MTTEVVSLKTGRDDYILWMALWNKLILLYNPAESGQADSYTRIYRNQHTNSLTVLPTFNAHTG